MSQEIVLLALLVANGALLYFDHRANKQLEATRKQAEQWQKLCAELQAQLVASHEAQCAAAQQSAELQAKVAWERVVGPGYLGHGP